MEPVFATVQLPLWSWLQPVHLRNGGAVELPRRSHHASDVRTVCSAACAVGAAGHLSSKARRKGFKQFRRCRLSKSVGFIGDRSIYMQASSEGEQEQSRQATPREKQFGMYRDSQSSSSGSGEPVALPIAQLHVVAAQRQLPLLVQPGTEDVSGVVGAWAELLQACQVQAPVLLQFWHTGVGPLLRFAAAVPREQWLRSPSEPWARAGADLSAFVEDGYEGPGEGKEAVPLLEALVRHLICEYEVPGVLAGGFIWNDGGGGVLRERPGREVVLSSGSCLQMCIRFIKLYAIIGSGKDKGFAAAKELLTPVLTKKMVRSLFERGGGPDFPLPPPVEIPRGTRHVQPTAVTLAGPLAALRMAQVIALGGSEQLGCVVAGRSRLGQDLGTPVEEGFVIEVISWACRFADAPELSGDAMSKAIEWFLSQHDIDLAFSLVVAGNPRSPKKVVAAAERASASLELQRMQTMGQRFLRNPAGLKGFVKTGVMASFGTPTEGGSMPEWMQKLGFSDPSMVDEVPNSWQGDSYEISRAEQAFLTDPSVQRRVTVRIDEIMSFEYLQYVGDTMKNCLRVSKRGGASLMKYLSRVRSTESSFWVMTITAEVDEDESDREKAPVQHLLLVEIYNNLKVIHQAEGPHPRRWPRTDAWGWLIEWAEQEGLVPDGPEGVTVGPYGGYTGSRGPWDINRCFIW